MKILIAIALFGCAFPQAGAQTPSGPVSGVLLDDRSGAIRRILGFPGASVAGSALPVGAAGETAVAPGGAWALVRSSGTAAVVLRDLLRSPKSLVIEGLDERAVAIAAVSANGAAALLTSPDYGCLQVLDGLPDSPRARSALEWDGARLGLKPAALDAGGNRLVVSAADQAGTILYWTPAGKLELHAIGTFARFAAWAMSEDGRDAAAVDGDEVVYVRDVFGAAARTTLIRTVEPAEPPVLVEFAGARVLAATAGGRLLIFDRDNGLLTHELRAPAAPSSLRRIGPGLIQLTAAERFPVYVLDLAGEPGVRFVPEGERHDFR